MNNINISIYKKNTIRISAGDRVYYMLVNIIVGFFGLIVLYPLIFVVSASFSSPLAVSSGQVFLWPVQFSLEGYTAVFNNHDIINGYINTFIYTGLGTLINLAMTMMAAYGLSRKGMPFQNLIMFIFTFTMIFDGGMIPHYILLQKFNMLDTIWALLIPGAISAYNMIIARTFIQSIPAELHEAAQIDGCSDVRYFFKVVLPLSKAVIAVLTVYYAVAHWNSYFDALIYLSKRKLYPLQIILREILVQNSISAQDIVDQETLSAKQGLADLLKYSLIIVSSVPVLIMYPFVQRYFVKGIMIGSLKG